MKTSILFVSPLIALTFTFGSATIKKDSNSSKASIKLSSDASSLKTKVGGKEKSLYEPNNLKDVYNDGTSNEEIMQVTKNLEYDFASSAIRPVYYNNLNKLAQVIINDKYAVSLRGYADSIGKYKPNWMLSEKRAIKVEDYLISKGVDKANIITVPFGSTMPIATNLTTAGRQKNRRVEIKLKGLGK